MEITLDIGKNVFNEIEKMSLNEDTDFDSFALKMIDLGLRVFQSSKEDAPSITDPLLDNILKKCLKTNFLLEEALGHIFVKERSTLKVYDHFTAITVIDNRVDAIIEAKNDKSFF